MAASKTDIPCERCGATLEQNGRGAHFNCPDCDAIVAPELARQTYRGP